MVTKISHEEIKTGANQSTIKPLVKYEHAHSQSTNIIQESAETEQKSIPVEANGESTIKVPENASLQQSVMDFYLFLLQKFSRKYANISTGSSSSLQPSKDNHHKGIYSFALMISNPHSKNTPPSPFSLLILFNSPLSQFFLSPNHPPQLVQLTLPEKEIPSRNISSQNTPLKAPPSAQNILSLSSVFLPKKISRKPT